MQAVNAGRAQKQKIKHSPVPNVTKETEMDTTMNVETSGDTKNI